MRALRGQQVLGILAVVLLLGACAPTPLSERGSTNGAASADRAGQRQKTITVGISTDVAAMSIMGTSGIGGGWAALNELRG